MKIYETVKHAENVFANALYEDGVTWYQKSISYSGGYYYGHYERWKS
ncbi:LCI fold-containing protein [Bacillus cereus group sp. MYBK234-1]